MKAKCAALLVGMLLLGATRAGATTYAVSEFTEIGDYGVGVGGSITTDGTLGPIGAANIVDWNLIGTAIDTGLATTFFDLTPINSGVGNVVNVTATANALTLGLANGPIIPNGDLLFVSFADSIEFTAMFAAPGSFTIFTVCDLTPGAACLSGNDPSLTFADGKVIAAVATTPLPAALPLYATGLGGLGLFGWRRKRKAQAVA
jgi:hypothetical protein